jgi:hypothetical protein
MSHKAAEYSNAQKKVNAGPPVLIAAWKAAGMAGAYL